MEPFRQKVLLGHREAPLFLRVKGWSLTNIKYTYYLNVNFCVQAHATFATKHRQK